MPKIITIFLLISLITNSALSATLLVPSQYSTIQSGIDAAVDGDTVLVADDVYGGFGNRDIGFSGKSIVVISENGPADCYLDVDPGYSGFYFHNYEDSSAILEGFTIINANISEGAAIHVNNSSPKIINCVITENFSPEGYWNGGGGIVCLGGDPIIENCEISENYSEENGGGMYCSMSSPILRNCRFLSNTAEGYGGGLTLTTWSNAQIIDCEFWENNSYESGGGVFIDYYSSPVITGSIFDGNYASVTGGGIHALYGVDAEMYNCVVKNNTAGNYGAGISMSSYCEMIIENCTISQNSCLLSGSGIYVHASSPLVQNSIISSNEGQGAISILTSPGMGLLYCDFHDNQTADFTGEVFPELGQVTMTNTNGDSCDIFYNIFLDPVFTDPGNGDFHLQEGSPCIDAGNPISPFDPDNTIADIGAFYFDQVCAEGKYQSMNPESCMLYPAYPNPFNRQTVISFELRAASQVELGVFDTTGREVQTLVDDRKTAGLHDVTFNASGLSSGIYFVRLQTGDGVKSQKLLLLK